MEGKEKFGLLEEPNTEDKLRYEIESLRENSYTEQECRSLVFDYAQFVIDCMEGKEKSLCVGAWFNKYKKNPDDKKSDTP